MKLSSLFVALILSVYACGISVDFTMAQSDMKVASESHGLFTVSFPADWRVFEVPRERIAEVLHLPEGTPTDLYQAMMIAKAPDEDPGSFVMVTAFALQKRVTPMDLWLSGGDLLLKGFPEHKTLDEGIGHPDDREVYYNRFMWKSDPTTGALSYSLMEIIVSGTIGYMFLGTTPNDQDNIQKHIPVFEKIVGTLEPGPVIK